MTTGERNPIRVFVVDDVPMFRDGVHLILEREDGFEIVGAAGDAATALRAIARLAPDVLVLGLPGADDVVEAARRVRDERPEMGVLVVADERREAARLRTLWQLGLRNFLARTTSGPELVAAVRATAEGRPIVLGFASLDLFAAEAVHLTPREREVLELLAAERHDREIADALSITQETAEFHVHNLLGKLGGASRQEAVARARRLGLLR